MRRYLIAKLIESLTEKANMEKMNQNQDSFPIKQRMGLKNERMERLRKKKNMHQKDLGEIVGVGSSAISQIETLRAYPNKQRREKIAKALGVSPEYLFPEWLKMFSLKWKRAEKERTIEIDSERITAQELDSLPAPESVYDLDVDQKSRYEALLEVMEEELSKKEREILEMRSESYTLDEVARNFGVKRERIRQIESKAIEKIRFSEARYYEFNGDGRFASKEDIQNSYYAQ